jgi:ectoine hydroxylase-related dioxygenase (phytanoyl-CoA dioxygenase family)
MAEYMVFTHVWVSIIETYLRYSSLKDYFMATSTAASSLLSMVEHYREQGYLVRENLLPADHIQRLRTRMQEIAEGQVPDFPMSDVELEPDPGNGRPQAVRKINRCAENDALFMTHAANDHILDVVESLIGPDIKLYASQCFMKPPGGVAKPYHQDSAYFSIEPMDLVTCWTALDDVTLDNGCLWVITGSHLEGLVSHEKWHVGGREDKQVAEALLDRRREAPITMPAGSCSFHHSLLLHSSGANNTDKPRRGLAVHYMSARCRWTNPEVSPPTYQLLRGCEHPGCV